MKKILLAGALTAAFLATSAVAQPAFGPPPYKQQPSQSELAAAFPAQAAQKGVNGVATATCKLTSEGALEDCKLVQEAPVGFGFGAALLSLAPKYHLPPKFPAPSGVFRLQQRFDPPKSRYAGRVLVGNPVWQAAPSTSDVARAFASLPAGSAPGELMFRCDVSGRGLNNCDLITGTGSPAYEGAARSLLERFKLGGPKRDVLSVEPATLGELGQPKGPPGSFLYVMISLEPAPKPDDVGYLIGPAWVQGPTPEQTKAAFPAKAASAGVQQGQAGVDCRLDASGRLTDCRAVAENPKDMGFGAAALSLASLMGVNPWTEDGHSVEGVRVQFALSFSSKAAPAAPGSKPGR